MLYDECLEKVKSLYSYVDTHLTNEFDYKDEIIKMINDSGEKHYLLDDAFIAICFIINNSDYKNISTSFSIRDFDFGELNRKLLLLTYQYFEKHYTDKNDNPAAIFPDSCDYFTSCNTTFLQPSSDIVNKSTFDKNINGNNDVNIVEFHIKNCRNMVFDIKTIIDDEFVQSQFSGMNVSTGVGEQVIRRFKFMNDYDAGSVTIDDNFIIDNMKKRVFQKLDNNNYRELTNSKMQEKDYELINYNLAFTNWENKRILALRQTIPRVPRAVNLDHIKGVIKSNLFDAGMSASDAILKAYYNQNMSDNDVLQIAIGAQMYQDKIPRNVRRQDFDKYFSIRDMESNIL